MDCYPGSPSWLESEVGMKSKNRIYFLDKYARAREGLEIGQRTESPSWLKRPSHSTVERVRIERVRIHSEEQESKRVRISLNSPSVESVRIERVRIEEPEERVRLKVKPKASRIRIKR
jgi:hypothetical protein